MLAEVLALYLHAVIGYVREFIRQVGAGVCPAAHACDVLRVEECRAVVAHANERAHVELAAAAVQQRPGHVRLHQPRGLWTRAQRAAGGRHGRVCGRALRLGRGVDVMERLRGCLAHANAIAVGAGGGFGDPAHVGRAQRGGAERLALVAEASALFVWQSPGPLHHLLHSLFLNQMINVPLLYPKSFVTGLQL